MPSPHSPRHGFALDRADHLLLRGRPPAAALAWAARAAGPGSRVRAVHALPGGTSSAVHRLLVEDSAGRLHRLVLRRYVRTDWLAQEPDLAEREAEILHLLTTCPVPTPEPIDVDPTGELAGVPAVLMTALPGRPQWRPADQPRWLHQLAEILPAVHATPVPHTVPVRRYRPHEVGKPLTPPPWSDHPLAWRRAIEIYNTPPATTETRLLHRDYHPGNVLWSRHTITGVIDWANASLGPPQADIGRCRVNLLDADTTTADRFLAAYRAITGHDTYSPYWDIAATLDLGINHDQPDPVLDNWLAKAVATLR